MPDYSKGKIYSIRSPHIEDVYIGSTTQSLAKRMSEHRDKFNAWKKGKYHYFSCFKIIELGDAYIELLEEFPCASKMHLDKREGEIMRQTEKCINKHIAGRSKKDHYNEFKEYYAEKSKKYQTEHREEINRKRLDYTREYRKRNREHINQQKRKYRERDKLLKQTEKININYIDEKQIQV